jgi:C-terminal processing protease CtpA/Prc
MGKSATVSYEDGGRGRIYVSVLINHEGPFPFEVAAIAGLKTGDRITSINSKSVSQLSPSDALVIFGGPIGSNVDLLVTPKDGGAARSMHIQLEELLP